MASRLTKSGTVKFTDWQLFTNNGNFNNPVPPNRRLRKQYPYIVLEIDADFVRDRCRTARSRSNPV
jgi:hypothetical protein